MLTASTHVNVKTGHVLNIAHRGIINSAMMDTSCGILCRSANVSGDPLHMGKVRTLTYLRKRLKLWDATLWVER